MIQQSANLTQFRAPTGKSFILGGLSFVLALTTPLRAKIVSRAFIRGSRSSRLNGPLSFLLTEVVQFLTLGVREFLIDGSWVLLMLDGAVVRLTIGLRIIC